MTQMTINTGQTAKGLLGMIRAARTCKSFHEPNTDRDEAVTGMAELITCLADLSIVDVGFIKNIILADFPASDKPNS